MNISLSYVHFLIMRHLLPPLMRRRLTPFSYTQRLPMTLRTVHQFSTRFPRRREEQEHDEPLYPQPPSPHHSDLGSFLSYVDRTGLNPNSTVYVGTHYEYTVASALSRYGISARRCGGASDFGIDLLGTWALPVPPVPPASPSSSPSSPRPLRVIVQCKASSRNIGPSVIRELEGSFVGAPVGWRGAGVLAFLVTQGTATKGVRDSLGRSNWPMGFISCSGGGLVRQVLWNRRAEEEGLDGIGIGLRYSPDNDSEAHVVLTHQGKHLPLLDTPA